MKKEFIFNWHRVGNFLLTQLSNMFSNINLTDMETCYKAFKSSIIKNIELKENRFWFLSLKSLAKIAKKKIRIFESWNKIFW